MNAACEQMRMSLDDSLSILSQALERLTAGQPVDIPEVIEQLSIATEAARNLRSLVASVLPDATWQSREDLDALLAQTDRVLEARSRLMALVAELERGTVMHRRGLRVSHLNQLREQAIAELCSKAGLGATPAILPGPEAGRWIEWACSLKEPGDEAALETLRSSFACLDNFVAHLEPHMWVAKAEAAV